MAAMRHFVDRTKCTRTFDLSEVAPNSYCQSNAWPWAILQMNEYLQVQGVRVASRGVFENHPFILFLYPVSPSILIPGSRVLRTFSREVVFSVKLLSHISIYAAPTRVAQGIILVESSISCGKSSVSAAHAMYNCSSVRTYMGIRPPVQKSTLELVGSTSV